MKYPLLAATFLALAVSACGDKQDAPVAPDPVAAPAAEQEQAPAPIVDVPMAPADDAAPAAPVEEPPPPPVEEPPAPAAEPAK